jgi:DNA-binding transcriptional LysR family regulator
MNANTDAFDGMIVFCEVVEANGFTAAARKLGHSASHVSKEISRLEERLSARLLNRTTRTISLTETGRLYYDHVRHIIDDARDVQSLILSANDKPVGLLRASVPVTFNQSYLSPRLPEFLAAYPDVRLYLEESDRMVDLVAEGFDVVVRAGNLDDTDFIAKRLMTSRLLTLASPAYLHEHGTPSVPADLSEHVLIDFSRRKIATAWEYPGPGGKSISVPITPRVVCNSAETEVALCMSGVGITRLPSMVCEEELASGALIPILTPFEKPPIGVFAIYPSRSHIAAKVRAFVDFLAEKFKS